MLSHFVSGDYFCRVSSSQNEPEMKLKNTSNGREEFCDSGICSLRVALPTRDQITKGDLEFSNEDIRILEHPDMSSNSCTVDNNQASSSNEPISVQSNKRAAIGDKVGIFISFYIIIKQNFIQ